MSQPSSDSESVVIKLEAWFTALSEKEQQMMAPVIVEGLVATMESVDEEVVGFGQIGAGPPLLQKLDAHKAPTIAWLVGVTDWVGNTQPPEYLRSRRR